MKQYMKYIGLAVVLALFLATGVGCNAMQQMEGGGNEENSDKPYVAVIAKGFQHKFWQTVKKGAEQAAKDLDIRITFEGPDTEAQVDKQVEMLDAAISKNPVAICIAALDSRSLLGSLDKAAERGIALVGFDSGVDSDLLVATAATDNTAAAALAADKLAEAIGEEGKVGMVVHDQVSTTGRQRRDGFRERIESTYPNIEIVDFLFG